MYDLIRVGWGWLVMATVLIALLRHPRRSQRLPVVILSTLWVAVGVLALDVVAAAHGWWSFEGPWPRLARTPVDVLLIWALVWGALPVLVSDRIRPLRLTIVFGSIDIVAMPALNGTLVELGTWWLLGEALALSVVAFPALVLADLTLRRSRRAARVALQMVLFTGVLAILVPTLAVHLSGTPLALPSLNWFGWSALLNVAVLPSVLAITAVVDLHRIGRGTPYPWDPTVRVVSVGPYAYLANPMQTGAGLLVATAAVVLWHPALIVAAGFALLFSVTLAGPHERLDLAGRWAGDWHRYAGRHRRWLPTWRPRVSGPPGVVHIDTSCGDCSALAGFLARRNPVALDIRDASAASGPTLRRITYEINGYRCQGVEAAARAFEHLHLGWAFAAWIIRAPGVVWVAQMIGDLVGFGPRPAGTGEPISCPPDPALRGTP